jgi:hypothetical protein
LSGISREGFGSDSSSKGHPTRTKIRPICNGECATFIGFERDLLCQHHVARSQAAIWSEAPFANQAVAAAEFLDVGLRAVVDPKA